MASIVQHTPSAPQHIPVSTYNSNGLLDGEAVSTTPVIVKEVRVSNASGATRYIQLFDATALPADGAVPSMLPVVIINGAVVSIAFPEGRLFGTGLCWCSSTTQATKTIGGATDFWVEVDYVKQGST